MYMYFMSVLVAKVHVQCHVIHQILNLISYSIQCMYLLYVHVCVRMSCCWILSEVLNCCSILKAKPTAELEPITESHVQNDEVRFHFFNLALISRVF